MIFAEDIHGAQRINPDGVWLFMSIKFFTHRVSAAKARLLIKMFSFCPLWSWIRWTVHHAHKQVQDRQRRDWGAKKRLIKAWWQVPLLTAHVVQETAVAAAAGSWCSSSRSCDNGEKLKEAAKSLIMISWKLHFKDWKKLFLQSTQTFLVYPNDFWWSQDLFPLAPHEVDISCFKWILVVILFLSTANIRPNFLFVQQPSLVFICHSHQSRLYFFTVAN